MRKCDIAAAPKKAGVAHRMAGMAACIFALSWNMDMESLMEVQYTSDTRPEAGRAKIGLISDMARYPIIFINKWDQNVGHIIIGLITDLALY